MANHEHLNVQMRVQNQTGSALIETAIATPIVVVLVSGVLLAGYTGIAKIWIRHSSYEATICLASRTPPRICHKQLQTRVAGLLPVTVQRAHIARTAREARVRFEVQLVRGLTLREERVLRLPLLPRRGSA